MNKITLKYPIQFEGGELKEISVRRPKVKDVTESKKGKAENSDQEIALIAKLSGLPPAAIEDLDLADYTAIQEVLQSFFG